MDYKLKGSLNKDLSKSYWNRYKSLDDSYREGYSRLTQELYELIEERIMDESNYEFYKDEEGSNLSEGLGCLKTLLSLTWSTPSGRISCLNDLLNADLPVYPLSDLKGEVFYLLQELTAVKESYEIWYCNNPVIGG